MELIKAERDKGILKETAKKLQLHKAKRIYKAFCDLKVTRPSFFLGGHHPTLKLPGILTITFIVSLTHRMDNI